MMMTQACAWKDKSTYILQRYAWILLVVLHGCCLYNGFQYVAGAVIDLTRGLNTIIVTGSY